MNSKAFLMTVFAIVLALCLAPVAADAVDAEPGEGPASIEEYTKYYYNQLDDVGMDFYAAMFELEINGEGTEATATVVIPYEGEITQEAVEAAAGPIFDSASKAISAFRLEQLWQYWFEGSASMHLNFVTDHFEFNVTVAVNNYYGDHVECNDAVIDVIEALEVDTSTYESAIHDIHDYIIGLLTYNTDPAMIESSFVRSIYTALVGDHSVVCEGYAKSFKVFCDYYNIPCVLVTGDAMKINSSGEEVGWEPHMWTLVQMENGHWYIVDCTWDDQTSPDHRHVYYLAGSDSKGFYTQTVAETHTENLPYGLFAPEMATESFLESTDSGVAADGSTWVYTYDKHSIAISSDGIVDCDLGLTGWESYASTLQVLVLSEGVTGLNSLPVLPSLKTIVLPSTITYLAPDLLPEIKFFCGTHGTCALIAFDADHAAGRTFEISGDMAFAPHALGELHPFVAPTCTSPGNVAYSDCGFCGNHIDPNMNIIDEISISPTGHLMDHHAAKVSTCTEHGNVEYDYCTRCFRYYVDGVEKTLFEVLLPMAPHKEKILPAEPAGPGTPGKTQGVICEVCDTILVPQETIPATDDLFSGNSTMMIAGIGIAIIAILALAVVAIRRR